MKAMRAIRAAPISIALILVAAILALPSVIAPEKLSEKRPEKSDETIKLLFVGDMMFDRGVARHADNAGMESLFRGVQGLLEGNDAVIGNLEGTITSEPSIAQKDHTILHFTFDPAYAALLKGVGFTAVSLANNHALDFYAGGFEETKKNLDDAGLLYFGSPNNDTATSLSTSFMIHGKNICLVGYHDLYTFDPTSALAEISALRGDLAESHSAKPKCDFIVLFAHWGDEYELVQSPRQVELAHGFIDAGADLVIGSHPHVVEPMEIYKGRAIFYSLGNFIFDQGLSFWTEHGLAVKVSLSVSSGEMKFTLIPTALNHAEASVASPEDAAKVLKILGASSDNFVLTVPSDI